MGMYTELVLKCRIKREIPAKEKAVLEYLFAWKEKPSALPDHPFFKTTHWDAIGRSNSFYHVPQAFSCFDGEYLFTRSDLKNYENEIDLFLDFINPYITHDTDHFLGWVWYESNEKPTYIFKKEDKMPDTINADSVEKFVDRIFSYHQAKDVSAVRFEELRIAAKSMARAVVLNGNHNRGEDIEQAIEHIRIALFYAISSLVIPKE